MNKELEEAWITIYHYNDEIIHDMGSEYIENPLEEEIDIVNNALLELKAIKEAKPSEALRCILDIKNNYKFYVHNKKDIDYQCDVIEQALLKAQKQEKFFDDKLVFKNGCIMSGFDYKGKQIVTMPLEKYDEFMKQEKTLEIIKEKAVDVYVLFDLGLEEYNKYVLKRYGTYYQLTEEEFNLLKRYLK